MHSFASARDAIDGEASGHAIDEIVRALVAAGADPARLLAELPHVSQAVARAVLDRPRARAAA